jgi:hypothetical protein
MPSSTATPSYRQAEGREHASQNHQRGARDPGHTFAGQHQGQHHQQLLAQRHVDARGLRYEDRSQGEIQRAANQVEAVAGGNHKGHDMFGHTELLHVFERQRQCGLARSDTATRISGRAKAGYFIDHSLDEHVITFDATIRDARCPSVCDGVPYTHDAVYGVFELVDQD